MDTGDGRSFLPHLRDFLANNAAILTILILLIALSAYFSCAETTYSSASKLRLKSLFDKGNKRAGKALDLSEKFEDTLTTVLFGNNLVNMATAAVTTVLAIELGISETLMTIAITAIVILLGEVLPKTVAKARADSLAVALAPATVFAGKLFFPFAFVFRAFSRAMTALFSRSSGPSITEDDVHDLIEDIDEGGAVDSDEVNLLYSAFEFDEITVRELYTPSIDVVGIDLLSDDAQSVLRIFRENRYSRMPAYRGNMDNTVGTLRVRTFLESYALDGSTEIEGLLDTPLFTDIDTPAQDLLSIMKEGSAHMAIVRDGEACVGIVTIEDLLEELVGEIFDESDVVEDKFKKLRDGGFEIASDLSVVSAFELMEYEDFDREQCGHETLLSWAEELWGGRMRRGQSTNYRALIITAGKTRHGMISSFYIHLDPEYVSDEEDEK